MEEAKIKNKTLLFDHQFIANALDRITEGIISEFGKNELNEIAFIGIQRRGMPFAKRLKEIIERKTNTSPLLGAIDISMYRDDFGLRNRLPSIHETILPFCIDERIVILVDDVLQSGRTIRAALDLLTDYGRPSYIRLAALIDRGMREYPIRADYTGEVHELSKQKKLLVNWDKEIGNDSVYEIEVE